MRRWKPKVGDQVYVPGVLDPNDPNYKATIDSINMGMKLAFLTNTNMPYMGSLMQWFPLSELHLASRRLTVLRKVKVECFKHYPDPRKGDTDANSRRSKASRLVDTSRKKDSR